MSCLTIVGRRRLWEGGRSDERLPFSSPPWTTSKKKRLVEFARSEDPTKRAIAAASPNLPWSYLEVLARDEDVAVRRWVAKNPKLPGKILAWMVEDPDPGIAAYARLLSQPRE